jgi:hypothetical protein
MAVASGDITQDYATELKKRQATNTLILSDYWYEDEKD